MNLAKFRTVLQHLRGPLNDEHGIHIVQSVRQGAPGYAQVGYYTEPQKTEVSWSATSSEPPRGRLRVLTVDIRGNVPDTVVLLQDAIANDVKLQRMGL